MDVNNAYDCRGFSNDNYWNRNVAIMLGRFMALRHFRDKYADLYGAIALSPEFFYSVAKQTLRTSRPNSDSEA